VFDDVELEVGGWTPFQLAVLRALRAIPYGEVVSYSDLARLAGHPRAQRAAGTFCAHNRFGLIVPCHRVVSTAGVGSYGSLGVEYKRRLLELEGVTL
jgi:methylated-DNA-[protein]-cysteine S-methyltransferase